MSKTRSLHSFIRLSGHSRWWAGVCVTGLLTTELGAGGLGRLTAALGEGSAPGHVAASTQSGTKTAGSGGRQAVLRGGPTCTTNTNRNTRMRSGIEPGEVASPSEHRGQERGPSPARAPPTPAPGRMP